MENFTCRFICMEKASKVFIIFSKSLWHTSTKWVPMSEIHSLGLQKMFTLLGGLLRNLKHWLRNWDRREEGRAQQLKEWQSLWGQNKNWLEPTRHKMAEELTSSRPWTSLYTHCNTLAYAKWHTHQRHDRSEADHKRPKSGWCPIPGNPRPFLY